MARKTSLDEFEKDLLNLTLDFKRGRYAKKFLKKEGKKLTKKTKNNYKSKGIGTGEGQSKEVEKSFKTGKVYKYKGKDLSVRSYNSHPLTHLLDKGHRIVTKKTDKNYVLA